jgi:hypothetical protein
VQLLDEVIPPNRPLKKNGNTTRAATPTGSTAIAGAIRKFGPHSAWGSRAGQRGAATMCLAFNRLPGAPWREPLFAAITFLTYLTLAGVPLAIILLLTSL